MSNLPTVNVTARVYDQSGKPIHKAVVTMRLTTVERYSGYIVPPRARPFLLSGPTNSARNPPNTVFISSIRTTGASLRVSTAVPGR